MSSNSFAALDDSGDEAPKSNVVAPASKKASSKTVDAPASKPDPKSKPKNTDRNTTKHGRGGRPPARDGKRTYDRRSGTGRGKETKKDGGGARNWGSDKNEAKKMEGRINEQEDVAPAAAVAEVEEKTVDVPVEEVEPPKVDNTISYADYIASKGEKEEKSLRETKNEFAGVSIAEKKEEESFMSMGGGKKKKDKKKNETEKKSIAVGFRHKKVQVDSEGGRSEGRGEGRGDSRGGRGDSRGGRGDRRDGRGRGRGGRGPKSSSTKKPQGINVQDESAFPSL